MSGDLKDGMISLGEYTQEEEGSLERGEAEHQNFNRSFNNILFNIQKECSQQDK